jgi:hypothetical protein
VNPDELLQLQTALPASRIHAVEVRRYIFEGEMMIAPRSIVSALGDLQVHGLDARECVRAVRRRSQKWRAMFQVQVLS